MLLLGPGLATTKRQTSSNRCRFGRPPDGASVDARGAPGNACVGCASVYGEPLRLARLCIAGPSLFPDLDAIRIRVTGSLVGRRSICICISQATHTGSPCRHHGQAEEMMVAFGIFDQRHKAFVRALAPTRLAKLLDGGTSPCVTNHASLVHDIHVSSFSQ